MLEFAYNNAKNASTGYTPVKLNCRYHPCISYEEKEILDSCCKSKTAKELSFELQELMIVCQQNSTMPRSFKSEPMIKVSNHKATPQVTRYS